MQNNISKSNTINDIKVINLQFHKAENGGLIVIESNHNISIEIIRIFTVIAKNGAIRGQHAHKKCSQFLTCPYGAILVECDDGLNKIEYKLDNPNIGILIPPGIWATQKYLKEDSILNVICNYGYDSDDYIRDYKTFLNYKQL
jgi:dTDP-4-dehydrorhamnose 3,5-epimerase-like enzyme